MDKCSLVSAGNFTTSCSCSNVQHLGCHGGRLGAGWKMYQELCGQQEKVVKLWNLLPREMMKSPPSEMFRWWAGLALSAMVQHEFLWEGESFQSDLDLQILHCQIMWYDLIKTCIELWNSPHSLISSVSSRISGQLVHCCKGLWVRQHSFRMKLRPTQTASE